jgi:sugar phosphate permease
MRSIPFEPSRFPFFYGWIVLGAGTLGILFSAPGQTAGVSAFTDSLIGALGVSRNQLSLAYMIGTLSSATLLSRAGRAYDRFGARLVASVSASALAVTLFLVSFSARIANSISGTLGLSGPAIGFVVIMIGFFLMRFWGQGVLTLSSRNMVMEWFEVRRGIANAIMGVSISFGFSYAPRLFNSAVVSAGWEGAWRIIALGVAAAAVLFLVFFRDTPEAHGLVPDGGAVRLRRQPHPEAVGAASFTLPQARRTYSFWVIALTLWLSALLITAYTFHVVSIFGAVGFTPAEAVAVFLPASVISVGMQFGGSWLSDRIKLKFLVMVQLLGMIVLSLGLVLLRSGQPVFLVILGHGMMQGMFGITSNITWPRFFGRKHLGAISGLASALTVAGSAVGPVLFSSLFDAFGSYAVPAAVSGVIAAGLFIAASRADRPSVPHETMAE